MKRSDLKLYCFSPLVMVSTFVIEMALAIFVVARYKMDEIGRLAVAMLVFLAIFQLAEYNVCATGWVDPILASRIGYVAITMLPAIGIHLGYALGGAKKRPLVLPAYITAAGFIAFFLMVGHSLTGHQCTGNYVIFQMAPDAAWLYAAYYYGWLLVGIWLCWNLAQPKVKAVLYGLAAGYLVFLLPTATVNFIDPETVKGIPSIMCGFAVLFAFILTFWILPRAGKKR
jgi:hypothetical protein